MNFQKQRLSFMIPVLILAFGALAYRYKTAKPRNEGPLSNVKVLTREFNKASSDSERARLAIFDNSIIDYDIMLTQAAEEPGVLNQDETATLEKMKSLRASVLEKVSQFYSSLSKADVESVTKENATSIYNLFETFVLPPAPAPHCDENAVRKLADAAGADIVSEHGEELVAYGWVREIEFSKGYFNELKTLLKNDARFSSFKSLDATYYQHTAYNPDLVLRLRTVFGSNASSALKSLKAKFAGQKSDEEANAEVYKWAQASPTCFVDFDGFPQSLRVWKTRIIGQKLFKLLSESKKPVGKSQPDSRLLRDAWTRKFEIESSGGHIRVRSLGPDGIKSNDDIVISGAEAVRR